MLSTHRSSLSWLVALLAAIFIAGCATGPKVTTEADPRADFSQYHSFAFYSPLAVEKSGYETPTTEAMKADVRGQMEARGYVYNTASPDLWVNINAYLQRRTDVTTMPQVDYGYYYSYRMGAYVGAPYWYDTTQVYQYTEGTMNIDLVDVKRNALVWEGIAVGRVSNLTPADRDARIASTVAEIFARYPYRAGSNQAAPAAAK